MPLLTRPAMTVAAALSLALLSACGGGGSSSGTETPPPPTGGASSVQGVATPTSVSVVTAKNAQ
jgi:hypothetical protein